jgi:hypothetical protein
VLHIESRKVGEIAVGDIAVCRRDGYLFGHRVTGKRVDNGRPSIATRPDRSIRGNDGPTYDEDVLGIVTMIERGSERVEPLRRGHPWPVRFYLSARLVLVEWFPATRKWLIPLLTHIQSGAVYRWLARLWMAVIHAKVSYVVQLPFQTRQRLDLFHPVPPEKFDVTKLTWQGQPPASWTLALYLRNDRRPAACATFALRPPECRFAGWWVDDLYMRIRYQGFGFERDLMSKAEEIFARSGVSLQAGVN